MSRLSADVYRAGLDLITTAARQIALVPVKQMLDDLEHFDAVGPILQPTMYRDGGGDNLQDQRTLLRAARQLQLAVDDIAARRRPPAGRLAHTCAGDAASIAACPGCGISEDAEAVRRADR